ncbi:TonB-dependent receptor [Salidesulfovibrio brasiliensis]
MEEMVVAAEPEEDLADTTSSVRTLTRDDIEALPVESFQDLLDMEAGITTYSPQGMGIVTPPDIKMRGTSSPRRVLLLVDGTPWNNPWTGYWYFPEIPVEAIERMEVIYGPYAARYGMNAEGGVIKVTTTDGRGKGKASVSASAEGGNFGRFSTTETVSLEKDNASFFGSFNYYESDNWRRNDDDYNADDLARTDMHQKRGTFHARMGSEEGNLHLTGGLYGNDTEYGVSSVSEVNQDNEIRKYFLNLFGERYYENGLKLSGAVNYVQDRHTFDGEVTTAGTTLSMTDAENETLMWRLYGDLNGEYSLNDHTLTFGVQLQSYAGDKKTTDDATGELAVIYTEQTTHNTPHESAYSAYAQDNWLLGEGAFELILGCRYDYYDRMDDNGAFSPKGSLIWNYAEQGRARFSAGRAYRAPSLSERYAPLWALTSYNTFGINVGSVLMEGNPDLKAETTNSAELSFENEFPEYDISTRVTGFTVTGFNWIESSTYRSINLGPGRTGNVSRSQNQSKAYIDGVEGVVNYDPDKSLHIFASYQWQNARYASGQDINNMPDNMFKVGAVYRKRLLDDFAGLRLGATGKYLGRYRSETMSGDVGYISGYTTVDTNVALDFWDKHIRVYGECFNVFDEHSNTQDVDTWLIERSYAVGAQIQFEF